MCSTSRHILTLGDYSLQRELCHRVKTGDHLPIREAAQAMAAGLELPSDGVLIPIPSHIGHATDTLLLCNELSSLCGLPVLDVLRGAQRDSLYLLKTAGTPLPDASFLAMYLTQELPDGIRPLLVDNVIGTGLTMKAALALVPDGIPCTLAVDYSRCTL